jgi:hypothetical protein
MIALKTETTNIRKVLKPIRYIRCASPCNILAGLKAKKTKQKLTPGTIPTMHDKRFTSALGHEIRMPRLRHSERLTVQDACVLLLLMMSSILKIGRDILRVAGHCCALFCATAASQCQPELGRGVHSSVTRTTLRPFSHSPPHRYRPSSIARLHSRRDSSRRCHMPVPQASISKAVSTHPPAGSLLAESPGKARHYELAVREVPPGVCVRATRVRLRLRLRSWW